VNGSVVVEKVLSNDNSSFGYNAATGVYEDLMAAGIIDPTKVCILYLQFVIVLISSRTINTLLRSFTFCDCSCFMVVLTVR
jgi:chaperonin GroEL (HSP60 family)